MVNRNMPEKRKAGPQKTLRARFLAGDWESPPDAILLELLLTWALGRREARPLAEELIQVFGSLARILSATQAELAKVRGLGPSSIALLKVVECIRTGAGSAVVAPTPSAKPAAGAIQQKMFEDSPGEATPGQAPSELEAKPSAVATPIPVPPPEPLPVPDRRPVAPAVSDDRRVSPPASKPAEITNVPPKSIDRKFQVSNGYLLAFDQLARILHFLLENRQARKISRKALQEDTGLADRQVASLVSIGAAMGLIKPGNQVLTPTGLLIAGHDIFIEKPGSLEWCHYVGAGSFRNLIWFEIFNHLLPQALPLTQKDLTTRLRSDLAGKYSRQTISKSLCQEVRFVVDAYLQRNFNKLELLKLAADDHLYRRRYTQFAPLVLCAMIYDFCAAKEVHLFQVDEMATTPGSPAVVFGLDATTFRQQLEGLHERGWLRYETTHNLNQIRLRPGFSARALLAAYFTQEPVRL